MPKALEEKLKAQARAKGFSGERADRYVYGTLRKTGWKPSRERWNIPMGSEPEVCYNEGDNSGVADEVRDITGTMSHPFESRQLGGALQHPSERFPSEGEGDGRSPALDPDDRGGKGLMPSPVPIGDAPLDESKALTRSQTSSLYDENGKLRSKLADNPGIKGCD